MEKVLMVLLSVVLFTSCQKEETIVLHTNRDYGVIFKNGTHDSIYVQCHQFSTPSLTLDSQEESKPLFTENTEIEVKWFGKGTYFHQREKIYVLHKDEILTIELKNE